MVNASAVTARETTVFFHIDKKVKDCYEFNDYVNVFLSYVVREPADAVLVVTDRAAFVVFLAL